MPLGVQIAGLRGEVDAAALARKEVRLRIDYLRLRLSEEALRLAIPPDKPLRIARVRAGHLFVELRRPVAAEIEFWPSVTPAGRLRLEARGATALGGLPVPAFLVRAAIGAAKEQVAGGPGVRVAPGNALEIDAAEALWRENVPVTLAGLTAVRPGEGVLELEFGRP